jgi:NAD(P)-dependent dehydrogenase (short-subunit alcohol dehydrogenase family)
MRIDVLPNKRGDTVEDQEAIRVWSLEESGVAITGGTSGVGLAAAQLFVDSGVRRLALLGRNEERGQAACQAVLARCPEAQVEFVAVDANDPMEATRAVAHTRSLIGPIHILVNSTTSSVLPSLLHDTPIEEIGPIITQQALAPLHMTRAVLPGMREQRGGVIINIASDAGKVATPGETVIGGAMAAIVMFSRAAAMEAKRDGVRVNALTPSLIRGTPTGERVLKEGFSARLFTKAASLAHLGVPEADDLAGLIVFLASPAAARLTGQAISLNGGISAA